MTMLAALLPFAVLLLTLYGLGALAAGVLGRWGRTQDDGGWMEAGDAMALGTAVFLAVSGWLIALDAYSRAWLIVALGLAAGGIVFRWRQRRPATSWWRIVVLVAVVTGVLALQLRAALAHHDFNWCDDTTYLYLLERLRETGGLIDPWNNRRLTSLGGQTVLQGAFLGGDRRTLFLAYDFVIGGALLAVQMLGRRGARRDALLGGLAAVVITLSATSSVGELVDSCPRFITAALLLAALTWSARLSAARDATGVRLAAALGLLLAGLAALRLPYAAIAFATLASVGFLARGQGVGAAARSGATLIGAVVVGLAGWSIALQRSSGTWLFPLVSGNLNPDWPVNGPPGSIPLIWRFWRGSQWLEVVGPCLGAAVASALLLPRDRGLAAGRWWWLGVPLTVAAALAFPVVFPLQALSYSSRFNAPIVVALLLALTLAAFSPVKGAAPTPTRWFSSSESKARLSAAAAIVGLVLLVSPAWFEGEQWAGHGNHDGFTPFVARNVAPLADYQAVRQALPRDAVVLAAVEFPQELGFDHRALSALDLVDSTAPGRPPAPNVPPMQRLRWLGTMGITHLVVERPAHSRCLFNDAAWYANLFTPSGVWRYWTPYQLSWFAFVGAAQHFQGAKRYGNLFVVPVPQVRP